MQKDISHEEDLIVTGTSSSEYAMHADRRQLGVNTWFSGENTGITRLAGGEGAAGPTPFIGKYSIKAWT